MNAPSLDPNIAISFECFPPRAGAAEENFWGEIRKLETLAPRFVSITYGAGGSTRDNTHATAARIAAETSLTPAAHLTCIGASREEVDRVARAYWAAGIRHIIALRGDPQDDAAEYMPHPGGYAYAADLVAGLNRFSDFDISVAAYPEVHPEAAGSAQDLDNLKRKLDAGAARAISQFFFDPEVFLRYLDRVRAAGIEAPIVAGILPITNFERACDFAKRCGAAVPPWMAALFDGLDKDPATRNLVAAVAAAEQCRQLMSRGVREFHFYTLNKADLTTAICRILRNPVLRETPLEYHPLARSA
jgi:methylenetetrahydrofolate reductase (NADPH)